MGGVSKGSRVSHYWGADRRRTLSDPEGSTRCLVIGGALLVALFAAVNLVGGLAAARQDLDIMVLHAVLEAGSAALAVVVGVLCIIRWRLAGEAAALWAGVALLTFGTVTVALTGSLPLVYPDAGAVAVWIRPASRIATMALLAAAVASPAVDGRLGIAALLGAAAGGTAVLTVVFQQAPSLAQHLASAADAHPGAPVSDYGPLVVTLAWGALAAAFLVRGHRGHRPLLSWLGLLTAGLALAELTRLLAAEDATLWSAGAHLLRLTALSLGVVGATSELQRAFSHQSRNLMEKVVSAAAAEARVRAGRHEVEERAHEARNALAGIDGAIQALERFRHQLSASDRTSLVSALSGEIARLRRLVSADTVRENHVTFSVSEALAPVITSARARGAGILVDVDDTLTAYGRWSDVAEVVQNLLENATRYAPGSPVAVRGSREGDRILIRVEDRGPGVPPDQREAIFRRGVRGSQTAGTEGTGLGLYVAARLMHDQDGDLWLEERPGGGAVFVLALPAGEPGTERGAGAETGPEEAGSGPGGRSSARDASGGVVEVGRAPVDEGDEALEVADGNGLPPDVGDAQRGRVR